MSNPDSADGLFRNKMSNFFFTHLTSSDLREFPKSNET